MFSNLQEPTENNLEASKVNLSKVQKVLQLKRQELTQLKENCLARDLEMKYLNRFCQPEISKSNEMDQSVSQEKKDQLKNKLRKELGSDNESEHDKTLTHSNYDFSLLEKPDFVRIFNQKLDNERQLTISKYSAETREKMGMRASIEMLFTRSDMIIVSLTLTTSSELNRSMANFICDFNTTVKDVLNACIGYWSEELKNFQIVDERYVSIPPETTIHKLFLQRSGTNKLNFTLVNKYQTCFQILRQQEQSILINEIIEQNKKQARFQKNIRFSILKDKLMNSVEQKMRSVFCYLNDYIKISKKDDNINLKRKVKRRAMGPLGPVAFYCIIMMVILQLAQLQNFNVGQIRKFKKSFESLMNIDDSEKSFTNMNTANDFREWLENLIEDIFDSKVEAAEKYTFFNQKVRFIGPLLFIRTDTKSFDCRDAKCYYKQYEDSTKGIFFLNRNKNFNR